MKVCIVGDGLVSLTLAKAFVNEGLYVDLISNQKNNKLNKTRTIGITKVNSDFFNRDILNIKKLLWKINKIEIYSDNLKNEKILDFENNNERLFSIIKNYELYDFLKNSLSKNNFFKKKKYLRKVNFKRYNLIINCDVNSVFSKKYFFKKINKNYNSYAYTTIIDHKKVLNNNTAVQFFTKKGPLAFLPISDKKTSIVYSARGSENLELEKIINKYNIKYKINKINKIHSFKLQATNLRSYYFQNVLAFGDLLHKIHPLAGQGFNMSLRDIKLLTKLIKFKLNNGLELNNSICFDFEKKIKHKNYIFSNGIDFVYEFFKLESKMDNPLLSKTVQFLGKNNFANKFFTKLADNGLVI